MLEIKNLTVKLNQAKIVEDVSISIQRGEIVSIIGESGSGKSVTALSILKLLPEKMKVSGKIKIDGKDILQLPEKKFNKSIRWKTVAIIFQDPASYLNPLIKVGEQISEAIIFHEKKKYQTKEKVLHLLKEVQIKNTEPIFNAYPHQLSGGQKQRVLIAMALACNPRFLIADEPTTALDKKTEKNILNTLKTIAKKRKTGILFISHDIEAVSMISNKLHIMYAGYLLESGNTDEILKTPFHPYTKGLINCIPKVEGKGKRKLPVIPGNVPDIHSRPSGCPFHPRCLKAKNLCRKKFPDMKTFNRRDVRCFFPEY